MYHFLIGGILPPTLRAIFPSFFCSSAPANGAFLAGGISGHWPELQTGSLKAKAKAKAKR